MGQKASANPNQTGTGRTYHSRSNSQLSCASHDGTGMDGSLVLNHSQSPTRELARPAALANAAYREQEHLGEQYRAWDQSLERRGRVRSRNADVEGQSAGTHSAGSPAAQGYYEGQGSRRASAQPPERPQSEMQSPQLQGASSSGHQISSSARQQDPSLYGGSAPSTDLQVVEQTSCFS